MTTPLEPATEAWDALRERIIQTELQAVAGTNQAREALLLQGDLFAKVAPPSNVGVSSQTTELLKQMAKEAGIAFETARHRRTLSLQLAARGHLRELLDDSSDIEISWTFLQAILAKSREPEVDLTRRIKAAREAGETRLKRGDPRRQRGMQLTPDPTPQPQPAPTQPEPEQDERPTYNISKEWQRILDGDTRTTPAVAEEDDDLDQLDEAVEQARPERVRRVPDAVYPDAQDRLARIEADLVWFNEHRNVITPAMKVSFAGMRNVLEALADDSDIAEQAEAYLAQQS